MLKKRCKTGLAAVTIAALILPGCVTTQADRIGPNDGSDACYQYRVALDSTGDYYASDMVKGVVIGAAAGAVAGGILGGDLRSAAIGAVAGGALGALGGYWNAKVQQGRDQAILGVLSDLDTENQTLSKTQVALDQLVNCRRGEIARVKADYKAKRIDRATADQRLAAIRAQLDKDYQIASTINQNVVKRRDEYLFAADQIQPGASVKVRAAAKAKKKPAAGKDHASQVVARTTTAVETSERINASTTQIQQMAQREATLEAV